MNFQESVNYLLSLGNEVLAMKLGLENVRKLLQALGDPQTKYLKVQVAGTNGKGSVCAFLNSICVSAGIRVGMFTSPHLISITERVKIDGVDIVEEDFARFATRVRETSESLVRSGDVENVPTFFEQVTAIALLAFADAKVELAILETGLGGRLDATTAANAEIAAITRIDIDHQQYLGETIEEIAAEKAAIIGENTYAAVVAEQAPAAEAAILRRCRDLGMGFMASAKIHAKDAGERVDIYPFGEVKLGLPGRHQLENAKVAILILEELLKLAHKGSLPSITRGHVITIKEVVRGLETARHPGRLEHIDRFLLDGAHNIGGARALRDYLEEFVKQPITMIFGAMNDKDVAEIAAILFPVAERIILTQPSNTRAMPVEQIQKNIAPEQVVVTSNACDAVAKAREVAGPDDIIVVTGSLYLVGEVRRILTPDSSPQTEK